jgi:hypothetical protein
LPQPGSVPRAHYRLRLGVHWMGWFRGCLPQRQRWVAAPWSGLTTWYVSREMRTVTYPAKGCTRDVHAPRKASTEASNLSKGEMRFNLSLSISFWVSTTREQDLGAPRVLETKAGSDLLQASPSHSRGELRRHHMFIMPHPVCNYNS